MKWAKNGFEGKNERFLSGICLDKGFSVIGFQFLVLSFWNSLRESSKIKLERTNNKTNSFLKRKLS